MKSQNELIRETSPYLLQHAGNPVHWQPWNEKTLENALAQDKLILISVGYAACHWCHVMEHESFEDEEVAEVMNAHFINIKVDREERPDVDQLYMNALQIMTGGGGWPMNVIALPDGRPFWGGTYFKKEEWIHQLKQISALYETQRDRIEEFASKLASGLKSVLFNAQQADDSSFTKEEIETSLKAWSAYFDHDFGGTKRAPKFMMPVNLMFLLHFSKLQKDQALTEYLQNTLTKIAYGGVFDHVGGGFARYSVDHKWHVPHFEKMLYDNAQLVSVYANAWLEFGNPLYKTTVLKTLDFVERELMTPDAIFYSALDADSLNSNGELLEGAFYTWDVASLKTLLGVHYPLFADYYNVNEYGYWEEGQYVLIRKKTLAEISAAHHLNEEQAEAILKDCEEILLRERGNRVRPRLDDKSLTSWNALMLKAYVDTYKAFGDSKYLEIALKNARFLTVQQRKEDGGLFHSFKAGKSTINGFLEDYAAVIDALIELYTVTLHEEWLIIARDLLNYCFDYFYDDDSGLFFFTSSQDRVVVTRTLEKSDNVIPASNSIMAHNLFKLGHHLANNAYLETAKKMLFVMRPDLRDYGYSHANWLSLMLYFTYPFYEIAVSGKNAHSIIGEIQSAYYPNKIVAGSTKESELPLLKHRYDPKETYIFVCENNTCRLPVKTTQEAFSQITGS